MVEISVKLYPFNGGDVRRFPFQVAAEGNGYYQGIFTALTAKVKTIVSVDSESRLELAWKDEDGDMILMYTDEEVKEALRQRKGDIFRIYVRVVKGAEMQKSTPAVQENKPINVFIGDNVPVFGNDTDTPRDEPKMEEPQAEGEKIHRGITCDGCDQNGITGARFKCSVCRDYDLCGSCEGKRIHDQHPMIRIAKPDDRSWVPFFMASQGMAHRGGMPCRRGLASFFGHPAFQRHQQQQGQQGNQEVPGAQFLRDVGQAVASVLNGFGIDVDIDVDHDGQRTKVVEPKNKEEKPEEKRTDNGDGQNAPVVDQVMEDVASPPPAVETVTLDSGANTPDGNQEWMILENPDAATQQQQQQTPVIAAAASAPPASTDPRLNAALDYMLGMGFTNEGGWLTQLLEAKRGDIAAVLDILHPSDK